MQLIGSVIDREITMAHRRAVQELSDQPMSNFQLQALEKISNEYAGGKKVKVLSSLLHLFQSDTIKTT